MGRRKHPGKTNDKAFSKWCDDNGFQKYDKEKCPDGMLREDRSGAMWLAEN